MEWPPIFTCDNYSKTITDSLQYCRENKGLLVHAYVIMPTHVHLILSAGGPVSLSEIIRDFKKYTSRATTRLLNADANHLFLWVFKRAAQKASEGSTHKVWTDDNHPETITSESFFRQKLDYLHDNPRRKGLVDSPDHWLYSSAKTYYLGVRGVLDVDYLEW